MPYPELIERRSVQHARSMGTSTHFLNLREDESDESDEAMSRNYCDNFHIRNSLRLFLARTSSSA